MIKPSFHYQRKIRGGIYHLLQKSKRIIDYTLCFKAMRRFLLLSFIILFPTLSLHAQSVSGKVQEPDGSPLPYANVLLLKSKDSTLVKGAVSSEAGLFKIENIPDGTYRIAVSMVGYQKMYTNPLHISEANKNPRLPTLTVQPQDRQLSQVTVTAQKPLYEQQIDKLVVNVQQTLTATGSTALDVLERSPGIVLNRQSNALSMSGKNGVLVMVNGKIIRLPMDAVIQMLNGMQAGNIEKIELITNPSARYDAEGDAGIINIVLKKNADYGTNGNVSGTMGYGWYERPAAAINVNHRRKKLNLFADYSFGYNKNRTELSTYSNLRYQSQVTENKSLREAKSTYLAQNARLGLDYQVSEKTTLGVLVAGFNNKYQSDTWSHTDVRYGGILDNQMRLHDLETNHWRHGMANLYLHHQFPDKGALSLDVDYLRYQNSSPHAYQNNYDYLLENRQTEELIDIYKETPIDMWVLKGDYSLPLSDKSTLEMGGKSTLMGLENELIVSRNTGSNWEVDARLSQRYNLEDHITAAYTNLNQALNTKTKLQAGLRYEYTHTDIGPPGEPPVVRRRYGSLFPSIFLSRDLSKESSLQGSYSRRIQRPEYSLLAPWVIFTSPNSFVTGNPALLPTFTDALQTTYRFKESYLLTLKYSHDRNALDRFRVVLDSTTNQTYVTPQNIHAINTASLTFSFPIRVTGWWQMQYNLLGVWQKATADIDGQRFSIKQEYANISLTQQFILPFDFTGELKTYYQTPFLWGTNRLKANGSVDAGLKKKLSHNMGALTMSITDIFWMQGVRVTSLIAEANQSANWRFLWEPRVVRLTYSRELGNQKVKAAKGRATGSEEERNRVGTAN
jgi:outer membrane receptor protein involved in Fe transport